MDEIVDELRDKMEVIPIPLELPDDEILVEVEEQILIALPAEYKTFLLTVSDVVYGTLEPVTVADPQSHVYLPEITALAWDLGLPRDVIPICKKRGDYYCITQDGEIVYWSGGEFSDESWESIWYWVRDVWLMS